MEWKGYDENGNIIYELINGNGKIKEYYQDGNLEFEGEYLKCKRNGKGKEYDNGKFFFEGEYLNGKINGKGKEYYFNGKLKFEGEYSNDKKWNGKGYDENGNIIYELINGNGKVKEYDSTGKNIFEGEYLNGFMWNGKVKCFNIKGELTKEIEFKNWKKK